MNNNSVIKYHKIGWKLLSFHKFVDKCGEYDHINKGNEQAEEHPYWNTFAKIEHVERILLVHAELIADITVKVVGHAISLLDRKCLRDGEAGRGGKHFLISE